MPMVIREAKLRDLKKTFQWANDKDVIRNSLNRNSKVNKSEHLVWFKNYLKTKKKMIFIGTVNRKPVGMVRLDYTKMRIFISYLIDAKSRKKGLGFEMLKKVVDNIASTVVVSTVMSIFTVPIIVFIALKFFS